MSQFMADFSVSLLILQACVESMRQIQFKPVFGCSQVKVLQLGKSHHRHMDRSHIDPQAGCSICKEFLGLLPEPLFLCFLHAVIHCKFKGFYLMVLTFENLVAINAGLIQDVWPLPIPWHFVGPELWVLSLMASSSCMMKLVPMWSAEFRTSWQQCCGRC